MDDLNEGCFTCPVARSLSLAAMVLVARTTLKPGANSTFLKLGWSQTDGVDHMEFFRRSPSSMSTAPSAKKHASRKCELFERGPLIPCSWLLPGR